MTAQKMPPEVAEEMRLRPDGQVRMPVENLLQQRGATAGTSHDENCRGVSVDGHKRVFRTLAGVGGSGVRPRNGTIDILARCAPHAIHLAMVTPTLFHHQVCRKTSLALENQDDRLQMQAKSQQQRGDAIESTLSSANPSGRAVS